MDLRQLKYFIAVAEERNVGRAASRLHLSQPLLTRQIQALESDLGVQLFTRTPRGVELTPAGAALLDDARNISTLIDQATERAQMAGQGRVGRLDIGLYGTAMFDLLPRLLAQFSEAHPEVKLVLHHGRTPSQLPALRQGRVLLVFERMLPRESDIEGELVAREPVLVALHRHHRLAGQDIVDMDDMRDEPWIMPSAPQSQLVNVALELCRAHGFEPRVVHEVGEVTTGVVLVACGMGSAMVPASMRSLAMPNVVYRPLKVRDDITMDVHCYYPEGRAIALARRDVGHGARISAQRGAAQVMLCAPGATASA